MLVIARGCACNISPWWSADRADRLMPTRCYVSSKAIRNTKGYSLVPSASATWQVTCQLPVRNSQAVLRSSFPLAMIMIIRRGDVACCWWLVVVWCSVESGHDSWCMVSKRQKTKDQKTSTKTEITKHNTLFLLLRTVLFISNFFNSLPFSLSVFLRSSILQSSWFITDISFLFGLLDWRCTPSTFTTYTNKMCSWRISFPATLMISVQFASMPNAMYHVPCTLRYQIQLGSWRMDTKRCWNLWTPTRQLLTLFDPISLLF